MAITDLVPSSRPAAAAGTAPVALRTNGLTKAYGPRTVVKALDLDVPAGVVSGFVGPNGAGKTTTIRMLLGLVRPTAGDGAVLGRPLTRPSAYLGEVGAMIEGPAFTPALSGADNLRVLARAGRIPVARVGEVLTRVGLAERGGDRYRTYSLGMKQRLGIAAALLPSPRLLVLDEPTNGLDPAGIAQMRDLIASFRDEGMTVFVSSHLLVEVEQVCDHLVMIREGALVFQGSVADLVRSHTPRLVLRPEHDADADLVADVAAALAWPAAVATDPATGEVTVDLDPATTDDDARAHAAELNRRAHAVDVVLASLTFRRPTLEEVFFERTGSDTGDVR